jgi:general secretion pathway protein A
MYTTYFGFREQPFNITPTSRLFYTNPVYEEAYTSLLNGVRQRKGLMVLTGEVGTGKTTVLSRLMASLGEDPTVQFAFSYDTTLAFEEFLCAVCEGFGLTESEEGHTQTVQMLADFLQCRAQAGEITALFIDEAQELEDEVLKGLLQLPDLQIVLAGQQPELEEKLTQASLSQLRQRIAFQCRLQNLTPRGSDRVYSPQASPGWV